MAAYITPALATVYFATRLYAEKWTDATAAERLAALTMAQQAIDAQPYVGVHATSTQTDAFPRAYPVRRDPFNGTYPSTFDTYTVTDLIVPQVIKDATCEEALALLKYGDSERIRLQGQGVTSASRGDLHEEYSPRNGLISPEARALLRPWAMGVVSLTT